MSIFEVPKKLIDRIDRKRRAALMASSLAIGTLLAGCSGSTHTSPETTTIQPATTTSRPGTIIGKRSTSTAEIQMAKEVSALETFKDPITQGAVGSVVHVEKVLPDGTQVEIIEESDGLGYMGKGEKLDPYEVNEIDLLVAFPGASITDKPEYGYDFSGQLINGKWNATYYQQFSSTELYSLGEYDERIVQISSGPGSGIGSTFNPSRARTIYSQLVAQSQEIIHDISQDHDLTLPGK